LRLCRGGLGLHFPGGRFRFAQLIRFLILFLSAVARAACTALSRLANASSSEVDPRAAAALDLTLTADARRGAGDLGATNPESGSASGVSTTGSAATMARTIRVLMSADGRRSR
jgi:hypothetical protein